MMNPDGMAGTTGHQHGGAATAPVAPVEVGKPAKAAVKQLFDLYFPLKDALVKSDAGLAAQQAARLKQAFEKTDMGLFSGPAHDQWMKYSGAAVDALGKMLSAQDLEKARAHFKPLSGQMVALAQSFGPFDETIYVQFCPMADNDAGADWLSLDKEIRNPYFGDKMMKCGKVTGTIK